MRSEPAFNNAARRWEARVLAATTVANESPSTAATARPSRRASNTSSVSPVSRHSGPAAPQAIAALRALPMASGRNGLATTCQRTLRAR